MNRPRFVIIGGGAMGETVFAAVKRGLPAFARSCLVIERSLERRRRLSRAFRVAVAERPSRELFAGARLVLLAVKPQDSREAMASLAGMLPPRALVISIMAGVPLRALRQGLRHQRVIRAMPNTPASVGLGMTVWTSPHETSMEDRALARKLFAAMGMELEVRSERMVNAATAISASGPAYVFAFAEAFAEAARDAGFSARDAALLVRQTIRGSAELMERSGEDPAVLRSRVTSKKGTTEAGLRTLGKAKLDRALLATVRAAFRRAEEISRGF